MQQLEPNQALIISLSPSLDYYLVGIVGREGVVGNGLVSKDGGATAASVSQALDAIDVATLTKADANGLPRTMMRSAVAVFGTAGKWMLTLAGHPHHNIIREVAKAPDLAAAIVAAKAAIG